MTTRTSYYNLDSTLRFVYSDPVKRKLTRELVTEFVGRMPEVLKITTYEQLYFFVSPYEESESYGRELFQIPNESKDGEKRKYYNDLIL